MNVVLGLFRLRSVAHYRMVVAFVASVLVFLGVVIFTVFQVWHGVESTMFKWLNGCKDRQVVGLQEQAYQPSPEYVACTTGVYHTAVIEASLVVGVVIAAAVATLAWMVEEFADDYVVRADGLPAFSHKYRTVQRWCGYVAIVLMALAVGLIFPLG